MRLPGAYPDRMDVGLAPPLQPGLRGFAVVAFLAIVYIIAILNVEMSVRIACVLAVSAVTWFLWSARIESLVPLLPLVFALGVKEFRLDPFSPMAATLAGFMVIGLWALEKIVWNRALDFLRHPGIRIAILGLLLQMASISVSILVLDQRFWNAVREGSSMFLLFPVAMIVAEVCADPGRRLVLLRSLVLTLLLVGMTGVLEYASSTGFYRTDFTIGYIYKARIGSTFSSANIFAGYLELMVPLALGMAFIETRKAWKILSIAAAVAGFLSVLYTFSRGGFFMTTGATGLVMVYHYRKKILVPVVSAIVFVAVMASNAETFSRQLSLVTDPTDLATQPTLVHRAVTYRSFWHEITQHPVTGIGWGSQEFFWGHTILYSFWDVRHRVATQDIQHFGRLNSLFLNAALKGGILGIAALAALLAAAFVSAARALSRPGGMLPAALAAGLLGLTGHHLVDNLILSPQINAFLWIQIGLLCAVSARSGSGCAEASFGSDGRAPSEKVTGGEPGQGEGKG